MPGSLILHRGLAGDRQVDAYDDGARQPGCRRTAHAVRVRGGVGGPDPPARQRLSNAADALRIPVIAETDARRRVRTLERERPGGVRDRLRADAGVRRAVERAGSVGQVREVASAVMRVAKELRIAVLLVGHVTKDGALAGPRVLEHLVDCVLQFEGERERTYRTVRAIKNRFGSTNEAGVFEMREDGLVEVLDASARFVAEATRRPGSIVLCAMEGSRPLLVEVQALVSSSELVPPRRVVAGTRPQPRRARAGRARPPRRDRSRCGRCVRERRRWREGRGAGSRPCGRAGGRERRESGCALARRRARRSRASANWGSPASCGRSHMPTGGRRGGQVRARAGRRSKRHADAARGARLRVSSEKARRCRLLECPAARRRFRRHSCKIRLHGRLVPGKSSKRSSRSRQESRLVRALEMVAPGRRCGRESTASSTRARAA